MSLTTKETSETLGTVVNELGLKLDKLTPAKRAEAIQELFRSASGAASQNTVKAFQSMTRNLGGFNSVMGEFQSRSGALEDAFTKVATGPAAKIQLLKNRWDELKIKIGEEVIPVVLKFVDIGNKIIAWFGGLDPHLRQQIVMWGMIAAGVMLVVGPLLILTGAFLFIASTVAAAIGVGLGGIIVIFGLVAAAIAVVIAIGYVLIKHWDNIKEEAKVIWHTIQEAVTGVLGGIGDAIEGFFNWTITAWDTGWRKAQEITQAIGAAIGRAVTAFMEAGANAVDAGFRAIGSFFRGGLEGLKMAAQSAWNAIIQGVATFLELLRLAFVATPQMLISAMGNVVGRFFDLGRDIIMGLINGAKSLANLAKDTIVNIVTAPVHAVRGILHMNSPSKVFHEMGQNTIQGYINGVQAQARPLAATMRDMTDLVALNFSPDAALKTQLGMDGPVGLQGAGGNSVTLTASFTINEASDPEKVRTVIHEELNELLRAARQR